MADTPDEVMFQEKGVFFANCLETIRAHQALATRFLSLEGKGGSEGGAAEFTELNQRLDDLAAKLQDQVGELDKVHEKLDKLFPEEGQSGESQPVEPQPETPPADAPPEEETPPSDTPQAS